MNGKKYPFRLFMIGFLTNIVFHFFWLFVPSIVLLIIGIFLPTCRYIGALLLTVDIVFSLIEQLIIRNTILKDSDNPNFKNFQDKIFGSENWLQGFHDFMQEKMDNGEFYEVHGDEDNNDDDDENENGDSN